HFAAGVAAAGAPLAQVPPAFLHSFFVLVTVAPFTSQWCVCALPLPLAKAAGERTSAAAAASIRVFMAAPGKACAPALPSLPAQVAPVAARASRLDWADIAARVFEARAEDGLAGDRVPPLARGK